MMSAPLRQTDFALIWGGSPPSSSEARPAKISAARTPRDAASKASGPASTSRPSASSEKCDLVGSLLRTALISELGALTPCSLRWRLSATPAGRSWFVLEISGPITSGPAHGSSGATLHRLPTPMATDGAANGGGGSGSTHPFRQILATPRKTGADRGFRGDVLSQLNGYPSRHAGMLPTPRSSDATHGPEMTKVRGEKSTGMNLRTVLHPAAHETLPTPTKRDKRDKRDKRMDAWSPAYDKRKSPTMDAVLDGAQSGRAPDKWAYARQIAALLTEAGLTGPSNTLPITYGWMMGFPPGWLARAFRSAMAKGNLLPASPSRRSATPSSRKFRKQSAAPSSE